MIIKQLFSSAKYIIRLDDACHFSDLSKWKKIESILDRHNILPIVAVIPENKDKALNYSNFNINFWELVKSWEKKGWTIAMHGYNHLFHKVDRKKLIFPYYNRSEFAELNLQSQIYKIKKALNVFSSNGVEPKVWIAPAHCFDETTMIALKKETRIEIISDGIAFSSYFFKGFYFIPQQIWKLKKKLFGLWTICLHPDTMTNNEILDFEKKVSSLDIKNNIICLQDIKLNKKGKSIIDLIFSLLFWMKYNLSIMFKKIIGVDE